MCERAECEAVAGDNLVRKRRETYGISVALPRAGDARVVGTGPGLTGVTTVVLLVEAVWAGARLDTGSVQHDLRGRRGRQVVRTDGPRTLSLSV